MFKFFVFLLLSIGLSCARPCPTSIKQGEVGFSDATKDFVSIYNSLSFLEFENSHKEILRLNEKISHRWDIGQLPLDVLCERGDFIDKTSQITYLETDQLIRSYASIDDKLEFNVAASIANDNPMQGLDTILYETFTVWMQDLTLSASGNCQILTSSRGHEDKLSPYISEEFENFRFVPDTIIDGRHLSDLYINQVKTTSEIIIVYNKLRGVECFITSAERWMRKY